MERLYFMKTLRIGFSNWEEDDVELARSLWGDPQVTRYICASGKMSEEEITHRLKLEMTNQMKYHVQYWPIFTLDSHELIGCCGLRPYKDYQYEMGIHLRPRFWNKGYALEACKAVIDYAFNYLHAESLFAGHHPKNKASQKLLIKLGFQYVRDEFYKPTGLYHPSYKLKKN